MTREEMTDLMQFIAAICPQQRIDRATTIAWYEVIGEVDYQAARAAVIAVKHSQPFVDASDILRESRRARGLPYERSAAEAIAAVNLRAIGAPRVSGAPTPAYLAAKDQLVARIRQRNAEMARSREVARPDWNPTPDQERKAAAYLAHALKGKLSRAVAAVVREPLARWAHLPGDPPELAAWLAARPPD